MALPVVLALLGVAPPAGAVRGDTTSARAAAPAALEHLETIQRSERLHELRFRTDAVPGEQRVRVLVPNGYDPSGTTRYPVLWLLHGGTGSFRDWTDQGDAARATEGHDVIVVMPDGSGFGNYVDWWNHGRPGGPRWDTYHVHQLLPWIDAHYPTVGTRAARAIAGLSMGGGGAMGYAARHPDLFSAAAAFSGAVDSNEIPVQLLAQTSGMGQGHRFGAVFGPRLTQEVRWRGHNPWDLAENLQGMTLVLATGNGLPGGPDGGGLDPVELACWRMMNNLHQRLAALGTAHVWDDYGPGGHNWFYWRRELRRLMPRLDAHFADPPAAPAPFRYRTIASRYDVHGWSVEIRRPALEFSRLAGAGPDGFALTGSGRATVTTAAYYEPGEPLAVEVTDAAGRRSLTVNADAGGRATVPVRLGPGSTHQQFTPQDRLAHVGGRPAATARVSITSPAATGTDDRSAAPGAGSEDEPAAAASPGPVRSTLPATGVDPAAPVGATALVAALVLLAALRSAGSAPRPDSRPG